MQTYDSFKGLVGIYLKISFFSTKYNILLGPSVRSKNTIKQGRQETTEVRKKEEKSRERIYALHSDSLRQWIKCSNQERGNL